MGRFERFIRFWFPVIAYSAIIFYISSIPSVRIPLKAGLSDKFLHIAEYIPFGFLVARVLLNVNEKLTKRYLILWVLTLSFLYGMSDEYHQIFVEGRIFDFYDIIADSLGGMIGGVIYCYCRQNNFLLKFK